MSDSSPEPEELPKPAPTDGDLDTGVDRLPPWVVPLLIGLVTITAGLFSWRAGQLASSSAFEDRQSVGQTIKQEQLNVEAGLQTVNDAVGYVTYRADFAEATALDSVAVELAGQGLLEASRAVEEESALLRESATRAAESVGVFGTQSVLEQTVVASTEPISFDIADQLAANKADLGSGIASPGVLDPARWARAADDTRERVRLLKWNTLLLLFSVLAYTAAELAPNRQVRRAGFVIGSLLYVFVVVGTFVGSFW